MNLNSFFGEMQEKIGDNWVKKYPEIWYKIASEALKGLNYIHSLRLIHADFKSENILLKFKNNMTINEFLKTPSAKNLEVKISDLGSIYTRNNQDKRDVSNCNNVGRTPQVLSPEYILSIYTKKFTMEDEYKTDIWAYGITMLEPLFFEYTMKIMEFPELLMDGTLKIKQVYDNLEYIQKVDSIFSLPGKKGQAWFNFIKQCLNIDPDERPTLEERIAFLSKYSS
jgi:serine/threonine protein kinase